MRRKESKIPLVVAAVIFAWMIFWAFGYVKTHQPAPPPAPVQPAAVATTAPAPEVQPQETVVSSPQPQGSPATGANSPAYQMQDQQDDENGEPVVTAPDGGPVRNRKMAALARDITKRH